MIRKFEEKDADRVMQIWLSGNIEAHDFVPKDYWLENYQSVKEQLLQADVYVYEQNGEIQGFVGMTENYLAGIFVDKKFRSKGIGKELLDYIKKNYPMFTLNVYKKNTRAVEFYLRESLTVSATGIDEDTSEADFTMEWKNSDY